MVQSRHPDEVLAVVERHLLGGRLQRCSILSSTYICRVKCFSCHLPQLPISFIEGCELKWHINDFVVSPVLLNQRHQLWCERSLVKATAISFGVTGKLADFSSPTVITLPGSTGALRRTPDTLLLCKCLNGRPI